MKETDTTTRTTEEVIAAIIEYFKENGDTFTDCIEELDDYNGYIGDDRYYEMDELDEFYRGTEPSEILCRAFYGHDADTYTTDRNGDREYGAFNPNRDYFQFNAYGNLVSTDYRDYSDRIDRETIDEMSENRLYIDPIESDDDLTALFDELEEAQANEKRSDEQ